jgi:hypothetical protein
LKAGPVLQCPNPECKHKQDLPPAPSEEPEPEAALTK